MKPRFISDRNLRLILDSNIESYSTLFLNGKKKTQNESHINVMEKRWNKSISKARISTSITIDV